MTRVAIAVPIHEGVLPHTIDCIRSIAELNFPTDVRPFLCALFNNYSESFFSAVVEELCRLPFEFYAWRQEGKPDGWRDLAISETMANIIHARRGLSACCRALEAEMMLWVDSDMVLTPETFVALNAHGKEIVGALCVNRHSEVLLTNAWYNGDRTQHGSVTRIRATRYIDDNWQLCAVDGIGLACVLVRQPLIDAIDFDYEMLVDDGGFCERARNLGYEIWADGSVRPVHLGAVTESLRERCECSVNRAK